MLRTRRLFVVVLAIAHFACSSSNDTSAPDDSSTAGDASADETVAPSETGAGDDATGETSPIFGDDASVGTDTSIDDSQPSADTGTGAPDSSIPGPVISQVQAIDVTQSTAMISWKLNQPATGQVEYGTTTAYGKTSVPELSFQYSAHQQPLSGLTAGTLYHFRVKSQNQAGGLSISGDYTFETLPSTGTSGNLPAKVVGGYFTRWDVRNNVSLTTIVDNTNYNLIYVAFATGVNASSGTLTLDPPPGASSAAELKSQVAHANAKGKKVLVSVGGYFDLGGSNSGYVLDSSIKVDDFMVSMRDFHDNWGFNGMDWDLEHGDRPDVNGIVDASRRMRAAFGSTWIINSAPGIGLTTWTGPGGVLDTLGPNGWDAVGEQVYDLGLSQTDYQAKIIERMTALANKYGANKVMLGNKYRQESPTSPFDPSSCVSLPTTLQSLSQLRGSGINIHGSFVWTIQSDSDQSYDWANGVGGDILSHP